MKKIYSKKSFLIIFLFFYFIIGSFYSLNTGLSFDEMMEQKNWEYNVDLAQHILFGSELNPSHINYGSRYYGIGFQIFSQPIQFFMEDIILKFQDIDSYGAHLVAKHFVVFIFFFISGIFVYLITSKIIKNIFFCSFVTILYLLYPYLLGHGLFNPKDIPFLTIWIVCTYVSINILTKLSNQIYLKYKDIILISFLSAFLLSIRVAGILIFIQYFFTLVLFLNIEKLSFITFFKNNYKKFFTFFLVTIFLTYLFYPTFWKNPFLFIDAINSMSRYYNDVCTLTLGKCIFSKNIDPVYIPIWLSVKLPVIILIGLILLPFTEKKIFSDKESKITFGTLLFSSLFIPIILIIGKVHLYDEIRQILFLVPLLFILGVVSFHYFSKKIFYIFSFFTLLIFLVENVTIYPYQYVWFNTPSRVLNLSKNFELDYWGLSGRNLAHNISKINKKVLPKPCILLTPSWLVRPFLDDELYKCFGFWGEIDSDYPRPFLAIQNIRNLKKGKSYKCKSIYESKFNLLFSNEDLITGRILNCS